MSLTLVDADILIGAAAYIEEAVACLKYLEQESTLVICAVVEMELLVGCRNKAELQKTDRLLERFQLVPLNEQVPITLSN